MRHQDRRVGHTGIRKGKGLKTVGISVANVATTTLSKTVAKSSHRITAHTKLLVEGVEEVEATGWGETVDQLLVALEQQQGFLSQGPVGSPLCRLGSLGLTRMTPWQL